MSDIAEPAGPTPADEASAITTGALSGLVVLDLADRALLAGRMLAQLGARVTLIEPPGGSPAATYAGAIALGPLMRHPEHR
jgi:crotonobetainyl-CoA:carnitine CoA-transferase CaiB-like acyl-CoA transferase